MKTRLPVLLLTLVVISVMTCTPALAKAPDRFTVPWEETINFGTCTGGGDVMLHFDELVKGTSSANADGTYLWQMHVTGVGTAYISGNTSLPATLVQNVRFVTSDATPPWEALFLNVVSFTQSGNLKVVAPGAGTIYLNAGLWSDSKLVGHQGSLSALCEALK